MAGRVALVTCVHHKPWLAMSTLVTTLVQDHQDVDLHTVFNVGGGGPRRPGYAEYYDLASKCGINTQLSPHDDRVHDVCRVNRPGVFEYEYENDHALDSGAWYKFIRDGHWRSYDYVLFAGEGTLFSRPTSLSGMLAFAQQRDAHFIASGHEKRRLPKDLFLRYSTRHDHPTPIDRLHERMIREVFRIFCRDDAFQRVFDAWESSFSPETQDHVPDIPPRSWLARRIRTSIGRRWGASYLAGERELAWPTRMLQRAPLTMDYMASRFDLWRQGASGVREPEEPVVVVNGVVTRLADVVTTESVHGVRFHRVDGPEWFGCATIHVMSRPFLERLSTKLETFEMYDVLDLPFAGTALEIVWGMMPAWLGVDKWFTDGFHRVRKSFVTYVREDYPAEMASYVNRYHRGVVAVASEGDYLKVRAYRRGLERLSEQLPAEYF